MLLEVLVQNMLFTLFLRVTWIKARQTAGTKVFFYLTVKSVDTEPILLTVFILDGKVQ